MIGCGLYSLFTKSYTNAAILGDLSGLLYLAYMLAGVVIALLADLCDVIIDFIF